MSEVYHGNDGQAGLSLDTRLNGTEYCELSAMRNATKILVSILTQLNA